MRAGLALVLMAVLGFFAPQLVRIFMSDPSVVENGALMLRLQLAGMLFMGIVLISTCTFQSAGQAMGAFLLSVSRQGVIFAVVLMWLFGLPDIMAFWLLRRSRISLRQCWRWRCWYGAGGKKWISKSPL